MEKLILTAKKKKKKNGQLVRIDPEVLNEVDKVSVQTGYSYKQLVDTFCRYALEHLEIVEAEQETEAEPEEETAE